MKNKNTQKPKVDLNLIKKLKEEAGLIANFWKKLIQPNSSQYFGSLKLHAVGIGLVGLVGYVIKLIHIPINNILVNK